jgi:hypothetical protein
VSPAQNVIETMGLRPKPRRAAGLRPYFGLVNETMGLRPKPRRAAWLRPYFGLVNVLSGGGFRS